MSNAAEKVKNPEAAALGRLGGIKGGPARAAAMTPEGLRASGQKAAEARWLRATHIGTLPIVGLEIQCAVLSNGLRVLSQTAFYAAIGGSKPKGYGAQPRTDDLPAFLTAKNLQSFISDDLRAAASRPIVYRFLHEGDRGGGSTGHGLDARLIPEICDVYLRARDANALQHNQQHIAKAAEILMRGLARVGIIALVDEATGYQADRERDELAKILDAYIAEDLQPWVRMFPHEFFKQIHRLQGWAYEDKQTRHPQYVGKLINQYIYQRLPPGVLEELRRKNPVVSNGRRRAKHYKFLTEHTGIPHLDKQITAVTTLLAVSDDLPMFEVLLHKRFPKSGDQLKLLLPAERKTIEAAAEPQEEDS